MPFTFAGAFAGKGKEPKLTDFMWPFGKNQKPDVGQKVWAAMESARMYQNRLHGEPGKKPNG